MYNVLFLHNTQYSLPTPQCDSRLCVPYVCVCVCVCFDVCVFAWMNAREFWHWQMPRDIIFIRIGAHAFVEQWSNQTVYVVALCRVYLFIIDVVCCSTVFCVCSCIWEIRERVRGLTANQKVCAFNIDIGWCSSEVNNNNNNKYPVNCMCWLFSTTTKQKFMM